MVVDEKVEGQDLASDKQPETSQEPKAYSEEQVNKLMEKIRSDSLAELGRMRKATEEAIKKATEASKIQVQEILKLREQEELESARDEPDKVATIRERQVRRQKESELAEAQAKLNEATSKLQELSTKELEASKEKTTSEIASRLKVDPIKLAKMAKFTDGSAEAIEEIAKDLPKVTPPRNNFRPDSNDTAGGTAKTKTQIQEDYIKGKINSIQYAEKMKGAGFSP
jgi:hypothetical protein